jgi:hypothetical protein
MVSSIFIGMFIFSSQQKKSFEVHIFLQELFQQPLFPGESGVDQLVEIIKVSILQICKLSSA